MGFKRCAIIGAMIITQTPYRISFFGGGTDYPDWFKEHGGSVLSASIDKYCYITCRYLPRFFEHKHRFVYSKIESVTNVNEIQHPAIRGILSYLNWERGLEIHHDGDLPARSGLGSSSSFSAGLLNALYAIQGQRISKLRLAKEIIDIEQNFIGEAVGSQDQIAAVYGGFNKIDFLRDGGFVVNPVILTKNRLTDFQNHLMLFYTGQSRIAATIAKKKIENISKNRDHLKVIQESVDRAYSILTSDSSDLLDFGHLMHEVWGHKKSLSEDVSNKLIDKLYSLARLNGAVGGKVLGAGGGGFMLFFVPPDKKDSVRLALNGYLEVPFNFSYIGSAVTHYDTASVG